MFEVGRQWYPELVVSKLQALGAHCAVAQNLLATIYARPELEAVLEAQFGKISIGISVPQLQDFLSHVRALASMMYSTLIECVA